MSTEVEHHDFTPPAPQIDEGYWSALLNEGEYSSCSGEQEEGAHDETASSYPEQYYDTIHHDTSDQDWAEIARISDHDEIVTLNVVGYNRGGLLVEWRSLRGFVPASQLVNFPTTNNNFHRHQALSNHVGKKLKLRIIELSAEKNRLILSQRAAQVEAGTRADILTNLAPGDSVDGQITNLCDFGAFVDLGGFEGLIHISELSWGRVSHPATLLERGQSVKAYVLGVDKGASRIALSLKRLCPDPWQTVDERYRIGEIVSGIITNVVDFGAFVCIEDGLEGLIHVSELAEGHFLHPRNVVSEGQQVRARILTINAAARRLGLSLRLNS